MPHISPIDLTQPGPAENLVNSVKANFGTVPNVFATLAQSPSVLEGFLAFNGALGSGVLDPGVREQIALSVAGANQCDYCASAHTVLAGNAGIDADEAKRNLTGDATDPKTAVILSFVRSVVRLRGRTPPNALVELRNLGVTDAEIVEVLAHVGLNLFTNYFNHIADTEIDFPLVTTPVRKRAA